MNVEIISRACFFFSFSYDFDFLNGNFNIYSKTLDFFALGIIMFLDRDGVSLVVVHPSTCQSWEVPGQNLLSFPWLFQFQQLSPIWGSQRTQPGTCPLAGQPQRGSSTGTTFFCTTLIALFRREHKLTPKSRASLSRTCCKAECTKWWL